MPAKKVLIVEDDLLNRMFYKAVLEDRGCEVELVEDGARVLEAVQHFAPDLITMDIQLPNVSGRKLIRALQRDPSTRGIPILAITAYVGRKEEEAIRSDGARGFLEKPVTIERLLQQVDALLPRP